MSTNTLTSILCLVAACSVLTPASAQAPTAPCEAKLPGPSRLDYLVFASLADSSSSWGMSIPDSLPR